MKVYLGKHFHFQMVVLFGKLLARKFGIDWHIGVLWIIYLVIYIKQWATSICSSLVPEGAKMVKT